MIVINNRQYMGIDEAEKSLGVSVHHVRRWNGLTHPKCRPAGDTPAISCTCRKS